MTDQPETYVARDDIVFKFFTGSGAQGFFLRVASRHGHESAQTLAEGLRPYLREGVTLAVEIETPSRFYVPPPASAASTGDPKDGGGLQDADVDPRIDAVALAKLKADMNGHVTIENYRERYGDAEADALLGNYRAEARQFLAMLDAAMAGWGAK